ncbi:uncharacterized protein LOC112049671 [Bicyclus anynana]|uniref:Uncharacterized protein LOC112049671 n=1 Tax=Bicyclus anynana TaxID=110368 RepID=A0A6J1NEK8_BICAN|nr:uncharacterized protein LOC112049671 [Bicyclus anynana]
MYVVVALCFVALASAMPDYRPCTYDTRGLCMHYCEEGTYSYNTGCGPMTPEPTCENPHPVATRYAICDYSACYCKPPTVRDTSSKKCVLLERCPPKEDHNIHDSHLYTKF